MEFGSFIQKNQLICGKMLYRVLQTLRCSISSVFV